MLSDDEMKKVFAQKPALLNPPKISIYTYKLREIARMQKILDKKFGKELDKITVKVYTRKISSEKFWEQYKKILQISVGKNNKAVKDLLQKTDSEMKKIKEKEKKEAQKPKIDLSLPS